MALVWSPNGIVTLFEVDGKIITKFQSINFKDFRIETAKFINNGQELVVGSKRESGFFFYYHMNSLSVYSNFPFASKNYERIYETDMSLKSGYLTFANNTGTAHLFRLTHFADY